MLQYSGNFKELDDQLGDVAITVELYRTVIGDRFSFERHGEDLRRLVEPLRAPMSTISENLANALDHLLLITKKNDQPPLTKEVLINFKTRMMEKYNVASEKVQKKIDKLKANSEGN